MIEYAYDDGGRAQAGFKGKARDCTVRALSILTGRPYGQCYKALADANHEVTGKRSARESVSRKAWQKVYAEHGLVRVPMGKGKHLTYTQAYEQFGDCIVTTRKHVSALIGGKLRDTWDGRTYDMERSGRDIDGSYTSFTETHERKAMSVYVRKALNEAAA